MTPQRSGEKEELSQTVRRITISDETTGIEASVTVVTDGARASRIIALTMTAPGDGGIRAEHLTLLEDLGLTLPQPVAPMASAPVSPEVRPATRPAKQPRSSTSAVAPAQRGGVAAPTATPPRAPSYDPQTGKDGERERGVYRAAPPAEELAALLIECGSIQAVADRLGYPHHVVMGWVRRGRKRGELPQSSRRAKANQH